MTRLSIASITSLGLVLAAAACGSEATPDGQGGSGAGGTNAAGTSGTAGKATGNGGASGSTTTSGGTGGGSPGGSAGSGTAGSGVTGGAAGALATGGAAGSGNAGGAPQGGAAGMPPGGMGGAAAAGMAGMAGMAGGTVVPVNLPPLVTSASGAYWKTDVMPMDSTANATVTVNDTMAQTWEGFGGAFNELGWKYLMASPEMQAEALKLLFSATDGANFTWGRIPMGASDYAEKRYTCDDMGEDPTVNGETARPAADTAMAKFTLARDMTYLIPYIKAAKMAKADLRFWASPWTPPVWMKTGYKTDNGSGGTAVRPSYYDGGTVTNTPANLDAYAQYYVKFVNGYKEQGINIEIVSPQNEPGYDQNYPSALWDKTTYVAWVNKLGPAMDALGVKVMLGTLSNAGDGGRTDLDISAAVLADGTAKNIVKMVGVQWGVLGKVVEGQTFNGLPIWATEHKCGNYPWESGYVMTAPNDQKYAVESWGYLRDAIAKGKVTSYSAWNMVLDKGGVGNDLSRHWAQNALLVADAGKVNPTPTYYVFRHISQYVQVGAKVLSTTGGDAIAFKNPDNSIVAVAYSAQANASFVVAMGGKKYQFSMPAGGWATVLHKP